ncbi:hypothetical protein [Natronosalvus rutilus]|uniref:hypothetical protein n=1 Tax=Natronosalvus rutilus TaxID=2953753 RepID=UPI0028803121|nr:hypothetical protein [Natronosalvus rutilus]
MIPVRAFAEADGVSRADAHVLENVVSLCLPCHRRAEFSQISVETLRADAGLGTA